MTSTKASETVSKSKNIEVVNGYEVPSWTGKPNISGLHLDVTKEGKLIQKVLVDEKKYYFFGRNPTMNDICVDHSSCSRVHAVLLFHKILERFFLVDLGSTHGTFIGSIKLEAHKPTQLPPGSQVHFGASTRVFVLREKPQGSKDVKVIGDSCSTSNNEGEAPLPEDDNELDHLTEYNTATNKRISTVGISDISNTKSAPNPNKKRKFVLFREEEEIINPEDIDPSVGKFRNLAQSVVIPSAKRSKQTVSTTSSPSKSSYHIFRPEHTPTTTSSDLSSLNPLISSSLSLRLGINLANPAPIYDDEDMTEQPQASEASHPQPLRVVQHEATVSDLPEEHDHNKKKYAKEAWPGRMPPNF
jgi:nuclear inhibitor of protein phosphatase 1